jgi:hypothetical protein
MQYTIETYDKEFDQIKKETVSLMGLRVFCEQIMYPKLNSGEIQAVLILQERKKRAD